MTENSSVWQRSPLFPIAATLFLAVQGFMALPAAAQETSEAQKLQRIIEEQQGQLDAQRQQLQEQEQKLQQLQQQVKELKEGAVPSKAPGADTPEATPSAGAAFSRRTDTQTRRRDKAQPHEEWKGSFAVEGLNTRFKIGGFAELDVIHDTDAIESKGQFITSTIVTGNATKAQGADGETNFSINPSRLYFETRTPLKQRRLTTFLSIDLFGDALSVDPDLRIRQVYGELTNILFGGDLLIGQAWSTFTDLEAFPNTLDFQGPNSFFGLRQPLVRWSKGIANDLKLMVAAETPNNHIIQGADSLTTWPDGVLSLVWDRAPVHLMGAFVARDLRASFNDGPTETALGWGASFSGKVGLPFAAKKDFLTFSATYGEGIGSDFNDQPPDAVFNTADSSLDAIPVFGWNLSYEHWWSQKFYSVFVYSVLDADNQAAQPPDSFKKTQYASANVVWTPIERWLFGIEALYGTREDKDGADGMDIRYQFTSRFSF